MRRALWCLGLIACLAAFTFGQAKQSGPENGSSTQLPPEQALGQAPLMMGYDVAPGAGQDIDNAYPTNADLGYKGIVFGNFDSADAADEIVVDFGSTGLWYYNNGNWTQLSGLNPQKICGGLTITTSDEEIVADFGTTGLWYWDGISWFQMSGIDATGMFFVDDDNDGTDDLWVDFGTLGVWRHDFTSGVGGANWTQLSNLNPYYGLEVDFWSPGWPEAVWTFPTYGLWNIYEGIYTQLTGTVTTEDDFASGNFINATGAKDLVADFASLGLWLCEGSSPSNWHQISAMSVNRIKEVKFVGGSADYELLAQDNADSSLYWGNWNGSSFTWTKIQNAASIGPGWCETFDLDGTDGGDEEVIVPQTAGGAYKFDYSAGSTWTAFVNTGYFINCMTKGDYFGRGRDSTLACAMGSSSADPGLWLYEKDTNPTLGGWTKISGVVPDGFY